MFNWLWKNIVGIGILVALCSTVILAVVTWENVKMSGFKEALNKADANAAVVLKLYEECLNQKNFSVAESLVDPAFEANGERGVAGFLTIARPLHAAFSPMVFKIEDVIAQGDRVVLRWTMNGTHSGVWAGAAPTNKPIQLTATVIYQLKEGKIVAYWPMTDRLGLALQLGLVVPGNAPATPAAK